MSKECGRKTVHNDYNNIVALGGIRKEFPTGKGMPQGGIGP